MTTRVLVLTLVLTDIRPVTSALAYINIDVSPTKGIYRKWKSEIDQVECVEPKLVLSPIPILWPVGAAEI